MKILKPILLTLLLAGSAAAQTQSGGTDAPDVTVMKISWHRVERNLKLVDAPVVTNADAHLRMILNASRINENNSARASGGSPPPPVLVSIPSVPYSPPTVVPFAGFVYEFTIRNTGSKTIRNLVWEYSFTDPATQKRVGRRYYKSNVKILPGGIAKLTARSSLGPVGTIDVREAGQDLQEQSPDQMIIKRIKYADGSVWQRSSK